jgi:hypothetical protein
VRSVNPLFFTLFCSDLTFKVASIGAEVLIKQDTFGRLTGSFHSLRSAGFEFESRFRQQANPFFMFLFRSGAAVGPQPRSARSIPSLARDSYYLPPLGRRSGPVYCFIFLKIPASI